MRRAIVAPSLAREVLMVSLCQLVLRLAQEGLYLVRPNLM